MSIDLGYQAFRLRCFKASIRHFWRERVPFWIAMHMPARIAFFAFIRVHGASEVDWSFDAVARQWEEKHGL